MKKAIKTAKLIKVSKPIRTLKTFAQSKFFIKFGKRKIVCEDTGEVLRTYESYLKSKHWKLFKARFRKSTYYRGQCLLCYKTLRLHFHHITYKNIGNEDFSDVVELCSKHHTQVHKCLNRGIHWEHIVKQIQLSGN